MTFATAEQLEALAAPTPEADRKTRTGRGGSGDLTYVDARFTARRFNESVGPENWQLRIEWSPAIHIPENTSKAGKVIEEEINTPYPVASIGVFTENGWVWKSDIGDYSDIASVKGGVSDSFKRASVQWGVSADLYEGAAAAAKPKRTRKAKAKAPAKTSKPASEPEVDAEKDVVGKTGLTDKQKAKMFATLREAGVPDKDRKGLVHTITGKTSTKNMTNDDLDLVLAFTEGGEYKADEAAA